MANEFLSNSNNRYMTKKKNDEDFIKEDEYMTLSSPNIVSNTIQKNDNNSKNAFTSFNNNENNYFSMGGNNAFAYASNTNQNPKLNNVDNNTINTLRTNSKISNNDLISNLSNFDNMGNNTSYSTNMIMNNSGNNLEIIIYIEIKYLMIWNKEDAQNNFPEFNLMIITEFNDDVKTSEKIPLEVSEESRDYVRMVPQKKKNDLKNKSYRFSKRFPYKYIFKRKNESVNNSLLTPSTQLTDDLSDKKPIKMKISLMNYYKEAFFLISEENIFFRIDHKLVNNKFQLYFNILSEYDHKKIGNLLFNFLYNFRESLDVVSEDKNNKNKKSNSKNSHDVKIDSKIFNLRKHYLNELKSNFPDIKGLCTFKEETDLEFIYYEKINNYLVDKQTNTIMFSSINDISEGK
jgi:hypothetical protein